jgi:hypothetical protein
MPTGKISVARLVDFETMIKNHALIGLMDQINIVLIKMRQRTVLTAVYTI